MKSKVRMPSGITHMILSRIALDHIVEDKEMNIWRILNKNRGAYIMGSVGPDLPYMPIFPSTTKLADAIHTTNTIEVPLNGLKLAKKAFESKNLTLAESLFSLYVGYCSHLTADGNIHPFVRDMVGDYELAKTEHRTLEVKLDVLIADKYFGGNCSSMDIYRELSYLKNDRLKNEIFENFANSLNLAFPNFSKIDSEIVEKWLGRMESIFSFVSGGFPAWYQNIFGEKGLSHKDIESIRLESKNLIELRDPKPHNGKTLSHNFLKKEVVNLIEDVLPRYFKSYKKVMINSYEYVFEGGDEPTGVILEINLDTGRLLSQVDFNEGPAYGRIV